MLEVRPYPREASLDYLLDASAPDTGDTSPSVIVGSRTTVDLRKLSSALGRLVIPDIRRRRHLYNRIYHEASISDEGGKGISFSSMLLLLCHYVRLLSPPSFTLPRALMQIWFLMLGRSAAHQRR